MRPLVNWNRQLKEQLVLLPEQIEQLQAENAKLEQALAKPATAKANPKTAAKGGAQATTVATARPYLESS